MELKDIWIDFTEGYVWKYNTDGRGSGGKGWKCYGNQPNKSDYYHIWFNGKNEQLHRVIYSFYHAIPLEKLGEIDHIDRNPKNNKICNLRLVTKSENCLNKTKQINNKSGHKNISYNKHSDKWRFDININGKITRKCFQQLQDAIEYRDSFYNDYPDILFGN